MNNEKNEILKKLAYALSTLSGSLGPEFIPHGGADIAYAKAVSRDTRDIASVKGGITAPRGTIIAGELVFGAGQYTAKVLLTAMKFDPLVRSVGIIRCTPGVVRILDEMFFETCFFDPQKEPEGISTMDWGVASCCRHGVPDAIYSPGHGVEEPIARFFGEDPMEVANNIIMVTARIIDAQRED